MELNIADKSLLSVAIIPTRSGSKGVPRKNVRLLGDKPLIVHSILDAKESKYTDKVFVSTDNREITEVSKSYGAVKQ